MFIRVWVTWMSTLRFNHVFLALMTGAFFCAFVLPSSVTDTARVGLSGLFNPISSPVRHLALAVDRKLARPEPGDPRSNQTLAQENFQLHQEIAMLQARVAQLQAMEGERKNLGDLSSQCVRASVAGVDAAGRDALFLSAPAGAEFLRDEPVVYPGGLAGRLETSHGAARVRLITDEGFAVTGAFVDAHGVRISTPAPLVRGGGQGRLAIVGMKMSDCVAAGLARGDWVVLDDKLWPEAVRGVYLGRIERIEAEKAAPLFADIQLATQDDLTRLADVWVLAER
jgi:rod shape-determining protein MreC